MTKLAFLEERRTFPPKRFLLIVWLATLVISLYGLIATPENRGALYVWLAIGSVAFWQLWTLRWIELDNSGIRARNIFRQGYGLRWEEVTRFHEEEVRLNKGTYAVLLLSNEHPTTPTRRSEKRPIRIKLTADQADFETLRMLIRQVVPK